MDFKQGNALADFPWRWGLFWLLLPNIIIVLMWPIAGKSMAAVILVSGAAAIVFAQIKSRMVKGVLAALIFLVVTTMYVAQLFGVPPLNFPMVAGFLTDVKPLRSPEYVFAGVVLAIILALILLTAPKVPKFVNRAQYLFAAVLVGLFMVADIAFPSTKTVGLQPPRPGQPVDAATQRVGLVPQAANGRHVLIVLVEALGVPLHDPERAVFKADWNRPEWQRKYEVTTGTNQYAGSTTFGELRELCKVSANYENFDFGTVDCLPDKFARVGYETTAIHTFSADFFKRSTWYPKVGFQNMMFRKDLLPKGVRDCPGIFPGACDVDVGPVIRKQIKAARQPQFIYWLTLNTHTPVISDPALGTDHCTLGTAAWREEYPLVCRIYQLHHALADSISEIAMDPDLPPTDILIVGDHKPFIFDKESNERFSPDHVPWIYLKARDDKKAGAQSHSAVASR